jgi:predicted dehydrogenase
LDAVVVATHAESHAALALRALEAGHHVFVEKPMALTSADAVALCSRARELSLRLMVGHVMLYHPAVVELLLRSASGALGEVLEVHSRRFTTSRREHREGPWWSLAPHDVSFMRKAFDADPAWISASPRPGADAPGRVEATLSFGGARRGTIAVGQREAVDVRKIVVVGTRKTAVFDDRARTAKLTLFETPARRMGDPFEQHGPSTRIVPLRNEEPLAVEANCFVDAVLTGKNIPSDGDEGIAVTRVLESGVTSMLTAGSPTPVAEDVTSQSLELEGRPHGRRSLSLQALL